MSEQTTANKKDVAAGVTVEEFLNTINGNFNYFDNQLTAKQNKIFIAKSTDTSAGTNITISNGIPSGGDDGDILIIYEE